MLNARHLWLTEKINLIENELSDALDYIDESIDIFNENLEDLKSAIENDDAKKLEQFFVKTKKIRKDIIEAGQDVKKPDFGRK